MPQLVKKLQFVNKLQLRDNLRRQLQELTHAGESSRQSLGSQPTTHLQKLSHITCDIFSHISS